MRVWGQLGFVVGYRQGRDGQCGDLGGGGGDGGFGGGGDGGDGGGDGAEEGLDPGGCLLYEWFLDVLGGSEGGEDESEGVGEMHVCDLSFVTICMEKVQGKLWHRRRREGRKKGRKAGGMDELDEETLQRDER